MWMNLENILLTHCRSYIYEIPKILKSIETENTLVVGRGRRNGEWLLNEYWVLCVVMKCAEMTRWFLLIAQQYKCTRSQSVHCKFGYVIVTWIKAHLLGPEDTNHRFCKAQSCGLSQKRSSWEHSGGSNPATLPTPQVWHVKNTRQKPSVVHTLEGRSCISYHSAGLPDSDWLTTW